MVERGLGRWWRGDGGEETREVMERGLGRCWRGE